LLVRWFLVLWFGVGWFLVWWFLVLWFGVGWFLVWWFGVGWFGVWWFLVWWFGVRFLVWWFGVGVGLRRGLQQGSQRLRERAGGGAVDAADGAQQLIVERANDRDGAVDHIPAARSQRQPNRAGVGRIRLTRQHPGALQHADEL
jgi:hypothetical protein